LSWNGGVLGGENGKVVCEDEVSDTDGVDDVARGDSDCQRGTCLTDRDASVNTKQLAAIK